MAWGTSFRVRLMTPEATLCEEGAVESCVLPLESGLMGILPNHARFLGRLGLGYASVCTGHGEKSFLLQGGWLHVRDNVVEVLADRGLAAPLSAEALAVLRRQVEEMPSRTVEETGRRRWETEWLQRVEGFPRP